VSAFSIEVIAGTEHARTRVPKIGEEAIFKKARQSIYHGSFEKFLKNDDDVFHAMINDRL